MHRPPCRQPGQRRVCGDPPGPALVELRSDFSLSRQELADVDRGALDINLDDLARVVRRIGPARLWVSQKTRA
jgi:hypothetical protein